jgi:hypothetical protein
MLVSISAGAALFHSIAIGGAGGGNCGFSIIVTGNAAGGRTYFAYAR